MKMLTHAMATSFMVALFGSVLNAQTLYTYTNDEDGLPGTVAAGVTASDLTPVNGVEAINACGSGYSSDTWSTSNAAFTTTYSAVQFTLTPDAGVELTVTQLLFDLGRNPQGPERMRFAYSTDGGASWTNNGSDLLPPSGACGTGSTFTWDMADFATTGQVYFRIYGWDASNVNGQSRLYNGSVSGSTCTLQTFYADADGDGFGDAGVTVSACNAPAGYVADNTDCNDGNSTAYPGATEVCDGVDNDCDGDIDENVITAVMAPIGDVFTCKGDPFTWAVEECAGCTYQWFKNDNAIAGATSNTYSTTKPAYYNVQVTTAEGCFDVSEYSLLTTQINPNANIYYPNGLNICAPTPGTNIIVKVGYTATNTYQWYKDGVEYTGDGATSWRIFPSETGDYYCSITAASGCNRITETATVINSCRMAAEVAPAKVEVFPNPASDFFTIAMNLEGMEGDAMIQIMNITGQVVYTANASFSYGILEETIGMQGQASGIYVVRVIANGQAFDSRVVVE